MLPELNARGVVNDIAYSPRFNPQFGAEIEVATQGASAAFPVRMARTLNLSYHAIALKQLRRLLRRGGYDLIHCHSTMAGLVGRLAAGGAGLPVVYTPHCPVFATRLPAAQRRVGLVLERLLAGRTTRYIAVSEFERRIFLDHRIGIPEAIACIYNGIDVAAFDAWPALGRRELNLGEGDFVIGCIDRLTLQKNQTALLRALALLAGGNWRLLLVGGGEMTGEVRALAEQLGIGDRIAWMHQVGDARAYHAACDVIAHPSLWDSCPYTVLEAMAASRPVAGADVGGVGELLGGAGRLGAPEDIERLAANIGALGADTELSRSLGAEGRERLVERFPLEKMVEGTIGVYEAVVTAR